MCLSVFVCVSVDKGMLTSEDALWDDAICHLKENIEKHTSQQKCENKKKKGIVHFMLLNLTS